jgi:outer membrane protein insertion porin family
LTSGQREKVSTEMKAGSKLLNAVSAIALSAGVVSTGAVALTLASADFVYAATVSRIDVRGASRVDAATVKANISITPGKSFTDGDIDASVKRLYQTGYFSDVTINVSGGTLVVTVSENQLVNQVVFNGNRKIKDDKLALAVRTKSNGPYNDAMVQADIGALKAAYAAVGRSDVTITTQVVPVGDGRVNLAFVINEGDRTKITKIDFVGNTAYSDSRLQGVISTKESGILTFLTRKDVYDADKLNADLDVLKQFYYNSGYADFRVISSDAQLNEATNEYTLTVTVDEGKRYKYGDVTVESTVEGINADELKGLVYTSQGSTYSARDIQKSMTAISKRVATAGYPFARVTPRGNRNFENNTISVDYLVDQGDRAYVERIEIRGNTRTRDYVIRREFDISEGDAFNQQTIADAKRRLDALGFFSNVAISTAPGSSADRVVIVVDVQDQATGSFGIGAGYATNGEGFVLEASIEEKNFLGRGQFIRAAVGGGINSRSYSLAFTEPYFLGYRLAAGFDLFKNSSTTETNYAYKDQGFTLRVAAPITENLSTKLAYTYRTLEYTSDNIGALSYPYQTVVNGSPWVRSSITHSLVYNSLDDQTLPHDGINATISQEFAGIGGNSNYYKLTAKARYFKTLSDDADLIGSLSVGAGHVMPTSGSLKVFDQFTIGANEIRGFSSTGIGPRMANGDTLGGTTYFTASAEATFPIPGVSRDIGIRGAVFADAATLFGNKVDLGTNTAVGVDSSMRASVGASLIWISPFGPLRFDYAVPVLKESYDVEQRFKFGIQTSF